MRYTTALLVTGGATGHRFKDQLTAKIAARLYDLKYVHNPFPKDAWDEYKWEDFLGFGDNELYLPQMGWPPRQNQKKLKVVRIDKTAWCGSDLNYVEKITKNNSDENTIFVFTESARILLEQIPKNIRDSIVSELRAKYWNRRKLKPVDEYFNKNKLNVALHIRRGKDVTLDRPTAWRYTNNYYYINIIKNIRKALPSRDIDFHVYSEGTSEEFEEFKNLGNVYIHLCPWPPKDYWDLFVSFHHMVIADIVVTATSEFSYFVAHMNPNYILTLPIKSVVKLPKEERFAKTNIDGSFDNESLAKYFSKEEEIEIKTETPYKAYIKTDSCENQEVIHDLKSRLSKQNIELITTDKRWQDILNTDKNPFLYYRNPYLRFDNELEILKLHYSSDFPFIKTIDDEVVSVNPCSDKEMAFIVKSKAYFYEPSIKSLPILLGTHRRPVYLNLTLNSLLYNTKNIKDQKIYIVASDPDSETKTLLTDLIKTNENIDVVITNENLGFGLTNFGSKFFKLDKFIHFEDDGILPSATEYLLPFWTKQLNHRSETADLVAFRISEDNICTYLHRQAQQRSNRYTYLQFEDGKLWNYFTTKATDLPSISGLGLVIDSVNMYKGFKDLSVFKTDLSIYGESKKVCIINIPIYHLGANQLMDFENKAKVPSKVSPRPFGMNLRTMQTKQINLLADYEYVRDL
jgi:hypothetical protein